MTNPDDEDLKVFIQELNEQEPAWPTQEEDNDGT